MSKLRTALIKIIFATGLLLLYVNFVPLAVIDNTLLSEKSLRIFEWLAQLSGGILYAICIDRVVNENR